MEDLIHAFGIDTRLIVIQIFNFALLAGLLWYLLYKPVLKILDERKTKTLEGIKNAEEAAKAREDAEGAKRALLSEAASAAEATVSHAAETAKREGTELRKSAELKAEEIVKAAEVRAEEIRREKERESEAEVARAAILAAEKILNEKAGSHS